jgi:hypothetical protein
MIKIFIGKDNKGNEVYVKTFGLDKRYNAITNRKLSVNQRAKIQNARRRLEKQKEVIIY